MLTDCPRSSEEQLNEAVRAAKEAFSSWSQTKIKDRKEIVSKIADIVEANAQELAQILTEEQGNRLAMRLGKSTEWPPFVDILPVSICPSKSSRTVTAESRGSSRAAWSCRCNCSLEFPSYPSRV